MSVFYLIRHGSTDSAGHVLTGRMEGVSLNADGQRQSEQLVQRFVGIPVSAVYASPLERTINTAQPLADSLDLSVRISEALTEVDFGDWTGRKVRDLLNDPIWQRFNSFRSSTKIPGGECMLQIQTRVVGFLGDLYRAHPDDHIAIVSHGDPIKTAAIHYLGMHLDMFFRIDINPASVTVVQLTADSSSVLALNTQDVGLSAYTLQS
jgi:probable phosphomutase (TIGR03848 family)